MRHRVSHINEGGYVLFTLGSWEIHALFEDSQWVEIFHHCKKYNPIDDQVKYAYAIPGDTVCPQCNEIQPDEIQALEQMHNMDRPPRKYGRSVMEQLKRNYEQTFRQVEKNTFLRGNGVDD